VDKGWGEEGEEGKGPYVRHQNSRKLYPMYKTLLGILRMAWVRRTYMVALFVLIDLPVDTVSNSKE